MEGLGIKFDRTKLEILDQTLLPQQEFWQVIQSVPEMIFAIKELKIRGAPLIGVAAACALSQSAWQKHTRVQLTDEAIQLRKARPTAVNLMAAIERMITVLDQPAEKIETMAKEIFAEDQRLCELIGKNGCELIKDGDNVLTHCNAGGLATAGIGTAIGVIRKAHEQGKRIHVYVDETRPLLQGARLTTWELEKLNIPYTLIADNMAAFLMQQKKIQKIFVGADRIAKNGDFANKIGTYSLAIAAKYHGVPFYVAAPSTTCDKHCTSGAQIPIEERLDSEVRGAHGAFGSVSWAPDLAQVYNPAFDVTPAGLVTGWILDRGLFSKGENIC